jgi:aryl-alcohol dehydrogenase-like predicted oxidoreductase/enamine deaminase RidA (YjgF/YER057c/UK114 family)
MKAQETTSELAAGLTISKVVTGLWQIADMERDGRELDLDAAARSMGAYVDAGFTTFDMADHYGSSELIAGTYRTHHAGGRPVQLLTKWVPEPGGTSREGVREAVERALERLQADRLDLLQFHAWSYADPRYLDELHYLDELRGEGLIAQLGLTNFDTAHLRLVLASGIEVVSNQICYSLLDQRAAGAMATLCEARGVKILAFGTLAGGFLSERWLGVAEPPPEALTTWSQMKYKRYIDAAGGWSAYQRVLVAVRGVADRTGLSMANVASRFILEQPAVGAVIIGARLGQSEHISERRRLLEGSLDPRSHDELRAALSALDPIHGDCGDEYRRPPFLTASGDLSHHLQSFPAPYPTRPGPGARTHALSGTVWEDIAGFSRAVRQGDRILVSGTTATHGDRVIGRHDVTTQTHFVIDKIEGALQSLGGRLEDVVRTRIFVRDMKDWEAVARVHGARFTEIQPANTLVRADLVGEDYLVEIEAEALLAGSGGGSGRETP